MEALVNALAQLGEPIRELIVAVLAIVLPWTPLIAWIVFWLFAVNWAKLYEIIWRQGGIIGVVLIGAVMVLVWGAIAPPIAGKHDIAGLHLTNYIGKLVYVTGLFCIMFVAGSLQLSGFTGSCRPFDEPAAAEDDHDPHEGHGGGHGDAHGHGAAHAVQLAADSHARH